jgi:hypothetical protein
MPRKGVGSSNAISASAGLMAFEQAVRKKLHLCTYGWALRLFSSRRVLLRDPMRSALAQWRGGSKTTSKGSEKGLEAFA